MKLKWYEKAILVLAVVDFTLCSLDIFAGVDVINVLQSLV
jgi:hypothetical protein